MEQTEADMRPKLRILVAENSAREISAALEPACRLPLAEVEFASAASVASLLATIPQFLPDLMLLDLTLARPASSETVRRIRRAAPRIPLVVFAAQEEKEEAARCLQEGAMDYLFKSALDPAAVERVLRATLERNTVEGLADLLRDPLTGLYTRDAFLTIGQRKMGAHWCSLAYSWKTCRICASASVPWWKSALCSTSPNCSQRASDARM